MIGWRAIESILVDEAKAEGYWIDEDHFSDKCIVIEKNSAPTTINLTTLAQALADHGLEVARTPLKVRR